MLGMEDPPVDAPTSPRRHASFVTVDNDDSTAMQPYLPVVDTPTQPTALAVRDSPSSSRRDPSSTNSSLSPRSRRLSSVVDESGGGVGGGSGSPSPRSAARNRFSAPTQSSAQRARPRKSSPALQQTVFEL